MVGLMLPQGSEAWFCSSGCQGFWESTEGQRVAVIDTVAYRPLDTCAHCYSCGCLAVLPTGGGCRLHDGPGEPCPEYLWVRGFDARVFGRRMRRLAADGFLPELTPAGWELAEEYATSRFRTRTVREVVEDVARTAPVWAEKGAIPKMLQGWLEQGGPDEPTCSD